MKVKRFDGSDVRRVLSGMVTDQTVCARIASQWRDGGLFDSPWANLVGGWCVKHIQEYGHPPNGQLTALFEQWSTKTTAGEDNISAIEKFLRFLSDEYASSNPLDSDYLLDRAGVLFNKTKMRAAIELATDNLDHNETDEAYGKLTGLTRVELGVGSLIKPAEDFEVWRQAFDTEKREPLISYPGVLNKFLGEEMVRDAFVAFMAPDKTGKSTWLLDAAYRGVRNRWRVAYFEVGDMGRDGVLRRLGQRAARKPTKPFDCLYPVSVNLKSEVIYKKRYFKERITPGEAFKAIKKVTKEKDLLRLSCYSNSSVDVAGITSVLRDWEREEWVPDIIVIDYADILAPPFGVRDTIDQVDATWRYLRRLSQDFHALVLTATQSNAAAYREGAGVLGRRHFSGRKTKLAHVNGMIGLNVSSDDKKAGITRVNWVVRRDGEYYESRTEVAAGCFGIANPAIRARD